MIDGTPINPLEETHGTIPFDTIPVESIAKIEIVPGTGTTKYGGGTTGGYINIHTKKRNRIITLRSMRTMPLIMPRVLELLRE